MISQTAVSVWWVAAIGFTITTRSMPAAFSVIAPDSRVCPYGVGGGHTHAIAGGRYYMLFLINTAGVPSRAKFIRLV